MILPQMGLAGAIVGHFVGDYLLQNDWQALNKKRSAWACFVHCMLYTLAVTVCAGWGHWSWHATPDAGDAAYLIVFVTHFLIDRWQFVPWFMRVTGKSGFLRNLAPWSAIWVDNTFHLLVLWAVAAFVVSGR